MSQPARVQTGQGGQGPQTRADLDALVAQRQELRDQARDLSRRRNQLDEQQHVTSDPGAKQALQARMRDIDVRSARIESDLLRLDERIADAIARGVNVDQPQQPQQPQAIISIPPINIPEFGPPRGVDPDLLVGALVGEALAFVMVGVVIFQLGWKRIRAQLRRDTGDQSARLEKLQQAIDVIGVEVERISEGQRYVAKVVGDGHALGAGAAAPVGQKQKDAVPR
jgi:hypothetical protein